MPHQIVTLPFEAYVNTLRDTSLFCGILRKKVWDQELIFSQDSVASLLWEQYIDMSADELTTLEDCPVLTSQTAQHN